MEHNMEQAQKLMAELDPKLLDNLMRYYQKIKGLLAEIEVQLENPFIFEEAKRNEYVSKLSLLSEELSVSIFGVEHFFEQIASQSELQNLVFLADPKVQEFKKNIEVNLKKISKINLSL